MPRILAIVLDVVAVLVFAAIGRASHAETLEPELVARTAAPFLAATLMVWVLLVLRPYLATGWRQGALVWGVTLVLGMLFRAMLGGGIQPAFVAVAGAVLAAFMFGWRAIVALVTRGRPASRA